MFFMKKMNLHITQELVSSTCGFRGNPDEGIFRNRTLYVNYNENSDMI